MKNNKQMNKISCQGDLLSTIYHILYYSLKSKFPLSKRKDIELLCSPYSKKILKEENNKELPKIPLVGLKVIPFSDNEMTLGFYFVNYPYSFYYTLEKDYDLNEIDAFFAISKESVTLIVEGQIIGSVNISD